MKTASARASCLAVSFAVLLAVSFAAGCGPTLATLQPAEVAKPGHVQVAAGFEVGIPTGTLARTVDAGRALSSRAASCASQSCALTPSEEGQIFDAGASLAASPLSYSQHFAINYGLDGRTEAGLRWAAGNWRAQARHQVARREDGPFDCVVGIGVARGTTTIPLGDLLPVLTIDDFTRWTLDLPVSIGTSRSWFRAWTGVKLAYSHFDANMHLDAPSSPPSFAHFDGHGLYTLAEGGIAVGYRYLFIAVELTLGELFGRADATITAPSAAPAVRSTDLGGFVLYPAVALIGEL